MLAADLSGSCMSNLLYTTYIEKQGFLLVAYREAPMLRRTSLLLMVQRKWPSLLKGSSGATWTRYSKPRYLPMQRSAVPWNLQEPWAAVCVVGPQDCVV